MRGFLGFVLLSLSIPLFANPKPECRFTQESLHWNRLQELKDRRLVALDHAEDRRRDLKKWTILHANLETASQEGAIAAKTLRRAALRKKELAIEADELTVEGEALGIEIAIVEFHRRCPADTAAERETLALLQRDLWNTKAKLAQVAVTRARERHDAEKIRYENLLPLKGTSIPGREVLEAEYQYLDAKSQYELALAREKLATESAAEAVRRLPENR